MRKVTVAATQMKCSMNKAENIACAEKLVRKSAAEGAQIILLQELFETLYFCQLEKPEFFEMASEIENNEAIKHFQPIANELKIVLPISFFEKKSGLLQYGDSPRC